MLVPANEERRWKRHLTEWPWRHLLWHPRTAPCSHIKALSLLQVLQHGDWAHVSSCCCVVHSWQVCVCSQCRVIELQEDHLYSLKSVAGQCSHTVITSAISCFYQQIILLPRKPLSLSCPAHWIKSTTASTRGSSLSSLSFQEAQGRRENSWQMDSKKKIW